MATGAGWLVGTQVVIRSLGLVSTVILARLLQPSDFGLIALATALSGAIGMLTSFNLRVWLIRMPDPQRSHYDTLWCMSILRGAVIGAALIAASPWAVDAFDEPRLQTVLVVLAITALVDGLRNVGVVDFERELEYNREFVLFTLPRVGAFVVTVGLGIWLRSYWALVAGLFTQAILDFVLTYGMHRYRPGLSLRHWRDALGFSKWLLAGNMLAFAYLRADTFILANLVGSQTLGLYVVAREIANLASTEIVAPIRRVMLPGFAKLAHDRDLLREAFLNAFALIVLIGLPCAIGIALLADPIVRLLLGPQWLGSITLIQVLSVYALSAVAMANQGPLLLALGHARATATLLALGVVILYPSCFWATWKYGVSGGAVAVGATNLLVLMASLRLSLRLLDASPGDFFRLTWRSMVAAGVMTIAVVATLSLVEGWWPIAIVAATVPAGAVSYALSAYLLWRWCASPAGGERILIEFVADERRKRITAQGAAT
jgi:O-antigen/teichoic acid export membrane protein